MMRQSAAFALLFLAGLLACPMAANIQKHDFEATGEDALFMEHLEDEHDQGQDDEEVVEEHAHSHDDEDEDEMLALEQHQEAEEQEEGEEEEEEDEEDEVHSAGEEVDEEEEEDGSEASLLQEEAHDEHEAGEGEDEEEEEHEEDEEEQEAQEREAEDELEPDAEHGRDEELPQEVAASLLEGEEFLLDGLEGEDEEEEDDQSSEEVEAEEQAFCCFASPAKSQPDLCSLCYGNAIAAKGETFHNSTSCTRSSAACTECGGSWCEAGTGPTLALADDEVEAALLHPELAGGEA